MSSRGDCDRKLDGRRSSVVPRGATGEADGITMSDRATLKICRALSACCFSARMPC